MSLAAKVWLADEVVDADTFCEYAQQMLGVPWPTTRDKIVLKAKVAEVARRYPVMDWRAFCRVVDWMRTRHKRPARVWMIVESFREAWASGVLPELDPRDDEDPDLERLIRAALWVEENPYWRNRLIGSRGSHARRRSFEAWLATSSDFR